MRKSKFTDSQIMDAVKRVEAGFAVPDICRELGISTATFYKWRAKYGGMDVSMMSRMKELDEENRRLKKMYLEEKLKAEIGTFSDLFESRRERYGMEWPGKKEALHLIQTLSSATLKPCPVSYTHLTLPTNREV